MFRIRQILAKNFNVMKNPQNTHSEVCRVLIVGLGSAGWLKDLRSGTRGCTHAFSVLDNPHFELVGGVDTNQHVLESWKSCFHTPVFGRIEDALEAIDFDVLVIATPIKTLFSMLSTCLSKPGDFRILVEKPVIASKEQLDLLRDFANNFGDRIIVNLPRLFSPEILEMKDILPTIGVTKSIECSYSGDYLNTCLHLISMIDYLVPNLNWESRNGTEVRILKNQVYFGSLLQNAKINTSTFDVTIFGSQGTLSYLAGGTEIVLTRGPNSSLIANTRNVYQSKVYSFLAENGWDCSLAISGLKKVFPSIAHLLNSHRD